MASISFDSVTKRFPDGTVAVDEFSLEVEDGEFVVLVGPSGSGKTTAMRMVAGLEETTAGTIRIGGRVVNDLAPRDRNIGMVFQNYALYPHLNVADNIAFPLKLAGVSKADRRERVNGVASMLALSELLNRKPRQLSGGQRQRVAMGRAIVRAADAFLMDEPLSNLDAKLRVEMRAYISSLHQQVRTTTLYVTHDQSEAMTMGDRVALMRDGRLEQVGEPMALYDRPRNLFVASFIGSPAMNLIQGRLESSDAGLAVAIGESRLRVPAEIGQERGELAPYVGRELILGIRPEDLEDTLFAPADESRQHLDVFVRLVEPMGAEAIVHFDLADEQATEAVEGAPRLGQLIARVSPRTRAARGEQLRLSVDATRLHFFDPESGERVYS